MGKLLAKLCSGPRRPTHISTLRNAAGSLVTSPAEISKLLAEYYADLYRADPIDQLATEALLAKIHLPKLQNTQLEA